MKQRNIKENVEQEKKEKTYILLALLELFNCQYLHSAVLIEDW